MNINGEDITPQDILDKLHDVSHIWSKMMYAVIIDDPAYLDELPGSKSEKTS